MKYGGLWTCIFEEKDHGHVRFLFHIEEYVLSKHFDIQVWSSGMKSRLERGKLPVWSRPLLEPSKGCEFK